MKLLTLSVVLFIVSTQIYGDCGKRAEEKDEEQVRLDVKDVDGSKHGESPPTNTHGSDDDVPLCDTIYGHKNDSSRCDCHNNNHFDRPNKVNLCVEGSTCVMTRGSGFLENICLPMEPETPNCNRVEHDFYYRPVNNLCTCGQLGVCGQGFYCYTASKQYCLLDSQKQIPIIRKEELQPCKSEDISNKKRCNCKGYGECPQGFLCNLGSEQICLKDETLQACSEERNTDCRCNDRVCPSGYLCDIRNHYYSCISEAKLEVLQQKLEKENKKIEQFLIKKEIEEKKLREEEEEEKRKKEEAEKILKEQEEEEEKKQKEETERIQKEKEEKRQRDELERVQKEREEEEKRKKEKEEEEQRQREREEEEERLQKEEEKERLRKEEEEERLQKAEEERKKIEEEEKLQKEEEKRLQEEKEKKLREEEKAKKIEEKEEEKERKKLEKDKLKKQKKEKQAEKKQQKEEAKRRRKEAQEAKKLKRKEEKEKKKRERAMKKQEEKARKKQKQPE